MFWILIILGVCVAFYIKFKSKKIILGGLTMITGGVKTGKTTLLVHLGIKEWKKVHFKWVIVSFIRKILNMKEVEEPLLYSNIPLAKVKYVPLTENLILREKRFNYKSIIIFSEVSLTESAQDCKNIKKNENLLLFNKLIGHETRGGKIIYDTQSIQDCHFSIKRSLSNYFYIVGMKKMPFFCLYKIREMLYSEDNNIINTINSDVEDDSKWLLVPKRRWKNFDAYCYSAMTDELKTVTGTKLIEKKKNGNLRQNSYINIKEIYK